MPPLLRDGDRMSRQEFLRRWEAMPDLKWAELIDGVVHMPSPVSERHGDFHSRLHSWLTFYAAATPGCRPRAASTWLMSEDSAPQPDLALKILPEHGGQSSVEGEYAAGAPELIVEVSHTTTARDAGIKLRLYERSGVREYIIVQPAKRQIAWRALDDGKYRMLEPGAEGIYRSRVFPGLWLDPAALWDDDYAGLASTVQRGAATEEHRKFVHLLGRR
ncbi:MAG: Uma2 family endonuclease [Bryobacteraceae bacterium]